MLPFISLLPILVFLSQNVDGFDGMPQFQFEQNPSEQQQQEQRPVQWRLRQWRPVDINGQPTRFLR